MVEDAKSVKFALQSSQCHFPQNFPFETKNHDLCNLSLNFLGAINELFLPILLARKVDLANFSAVIMKLGISQVTREEFVKAFLRWTEDDTHYTIIIFFTTKAIINIAIIINNVLNSPFSDRRVLPLYLSTRWKHKYLFLDEMRISCR